MSIGFRIAVLCSLPVLLTVAVGGAYLLRRDRVVAIEQEQLVAQAHANQFALHEEFDILTEDVERLARAVEDLAKVVPGLHRCAIVRADGEPIVQWLRPGSAPSFNQDDTSHVTASADVFSGVEVVGRITLGLDTGSVYARLASRRQTVLTTMLLLAAVIAALCWFEGSRVSRSLLTLSRATERIAGGEYGMIVPAGHDELGRLGAAFNAMSAELAEAVPAKVEKEAAVAANRAKSEFLANMSHELRTPLHAVLSFARFGITRIESVDRSKLAEYFQRIDEGGQTLLALLNDLLDLAKLEAHRMVFDKSPADLSLVVASVLNEFESLLEDKALKLRTRGLEEPLSAVLDTVRLGQVVRNLLSNAAKFSPSGGTIDVTLERDGARAVLTISDEGPGIPADEVETIFDQFVQSSRTRTKAGGTGLGLAICREIIDAHDGRIWANPATDGGASVSFELPLEAQAEAALEPVAAGTSEPSNTHHGPGSRPPAEGKRDE